MKWWDKPIGRQEIAPHFVSVYGRGDVGGIFISYSGFSPAAIEDAKTGLAQKVFVLTELQEIIQVIDCLVAACERELRESDSAEATDRLEARIAATLANTGKQVQSLFTLAHAQFALTNSLLQCVLTCVVEPPEEVLPAARARAKARYAKILRLAGEEVATRNQATLEQVLTHSRQQ